MSANEALNRIDVLLKQIATDARAVVSKNHKGWGSFLLSVRWVGDSGVCDIIIESTSGVEKKYHKATMQMITYLLDLGGVRLQLETVWVELLLTVSPDGSFQTKFGYE